MDLGRTVKKLLMQGKSYEEIARIVSASPDYNVSAKECENAYKRFMGVKVQTESGRNFEMLLLKTKKLHLYGGIGVGKSFLVKQVAEHINYDLIISYPRKEEDLLKDFGDVPFHKDIKKTIFLIEGDNYYWKKYGLIKKYIEDSVSPLVIITNGKDTPTKNITKLITQVKLNPPTRSEVLVYLTSIGWKGDISSVYTEDWRITLRNALYSTNEKVKEEFDILDSKQMAYKIITGRAKIEDFEKCNYPISYVLNWLGYNASECWSGKELKYNLEIISWCDANKYATDKEYIKAALLNITPTDDKVYLTFPVYKTKKKETPIIEADYIVKAYKKAKKPVGKYEPKQKSIGDFLLI